MQLIYGLDRHKTELVISYTVLTAKATNNAKMGA